MTPPQVSNSSSYLRRFSDSEVGVKLFNTETPKFVNGRLAAITVTTFEPTWDDTYTHKHTQVRKDLYIWVSHFKSRSKSSSVFTLSTNFETRDLWQRPTTDGGRLDHTKGDKLEDPLPPFYGLLLSLSVPPGPIYETCDGRDPNLEPKRYRIDPLELV